MRPRPEGRGELAGRLPDRSDAAASMRPRPEGRGERPACSYGRAIPRQCFNAATTRRPWRTRLVVVASNSNHCFNAATTRRPWRTTGRGDDSPAAERASMRPRPEGRGEHKEGDPLVVYHGTLQCGHDPKAVENYSGSFFWTRVGELLQCGHDPKAVENPNRPVDSSTRLTTWLQCGHDPKAVENDRSGGCGCPPRTASMRPRPEGRGEPGDEPERENKEGWVQCGHDPKAVENIACGG